MAPAKAAAAICANGIKDLYGFLFNVVIVAENLNGSNHITVFKERKVGQRNHGPSNVQMGVALAREVFAGEYQRFPAGRQLSKGAEVEVYGRGVNGNFTG